MSIQTLQDRDGNTSSKRVVGSILIFAGLAEKVYLFYLGSRATELMINFNNLDNSANSLIITGAGLLGISVLEFFSNKVTSPVTDITPTKEVSEVKDAKVYNS